MTQATQRLAEILYAEIARLSNENIELHRRLVEIRQDATDVGSRLREGLDNTESLLRSHQ